MMAKSSKDELISYCRQELSHFKESMGYKGWIYCHTSYLHDSGIRFCVGDMHKHNSLRPVTNTGNWRAATRDEVKDHFEKIYNIQL